MLKQKKKQMKQTRSFTIFKKITSKLKLIVLVAVVLVGI